MTDLHARRPTRGPSRGLPRALPFEVPRLGLVERLGDLEGIALVVLLAPAGYGKTTFVAQLMRHEADVVWLDLEADDAEAGRLADRIARACAARLPDLALDRFEARRRAGGATEGLARALADDLNDLPVNVRLVLDRAEWLGADAARWLAAFVERLAEGHRCHVAAYQLDEAFPLARLVAAGRAVVLREDDLAFTAQETAELAARLGAPTEPVGADAGQGWPLALALTCRLGSNATPEAAMRELLARLPGEARDGLVDLAPLAVWGPEEARAIGADWRPDVLAAAVRAGLPLRPAEDGAFVPHLLLRRVLRADLEGDPGRRTARFGALARHLEQRGQYVEAVEAYRDAERPEEAERLLLELLPRLERASEHALMLRVLSALPGAGASPAVEVFRAQALFNLGEAAQAETLMNALIERGVVDARLEGLLATLAYRRKELALVLRHTERGLALGGTPWLRVQMLVTRSGAVEAQGDYPGGLAIAEEAARVARASDDRQAEAFAVSSLAVSYGHLKRREEARRLFLQALHLNEVLGNGLRFVQTCYNFAAFLTDWAEFEEAADLIGRGLAEARRTPSVFLPLLLGMQGDAALKGGRPARAVEALRAGLATVKEHRLDAYEYVMLLHLVQAQALLGRLDEVPTLLDRARALMSPEETARPTRFRLTRGFVAFARGDLAEAEAELTQALQDGLPTFDRARARFHLAEIARRAGRLRRALVQEAMEDLDELGRDAPLGTDRALLIGLYREGVKRRWFAERFAPWIEERDDAAPAAPVLDLRTLGRLDVHVNGRPVRVPLTKSLEVLAWLALQGPSTRDELVRALWGDAQERRNVEFFKVAVRRLRIALAAAPDVTFDPVPFEHGVYRLNPAWRPVVDIAPWLDENAGPDVPAPPDLPVLPGVTGGWADEVRRRVEEWRG